MRKKEAQEAHQPDQESIRRGASAGLAILVASVFLLGIVIIKILSENGIPSGAVRPEPVSFYQIALIATAGIMSMLSSLISGRLINWGAITKKQHDFSSLAVIIIFIAVSGEVLYFLFETTTGATWVWRMAALGLGLCMTAAAAVCAGYATLLQIKRWNSQNHSS